MKVPLNLETKGKFTLVNLVINCFLMVIVPVEISNVSMAMCPKSFW